MIPQSLPDQRSSSATEKLRARERAVVSKRLHDDVGPTLCAVGLHIGILKSSLQENAAAQESLATIESALSEAIQAVRGLSYRTDPGIVGRCGLRSALSYLCQDAGVALNDDATLAPMPREQAEVIFRLAAELILDAAESNAGSGLQIRMTPRGFVLAAGAAVRHIPSEETLQALSVMIESSSVEIERRLESGEIHITASARDARS